MERYERIKNIDDSSTVETYTRGGKRHREDGPARIERRADGVVVLEAYWRNGEMHRADGPALIERYADGAVIESYWRDNKLHREYGPAEIVRRADGTMFESYWRHGKRDREDGRAALRRWHRDRELLARRQADRATPRCFTDTAGERPPHCAVAIKTTSPGLSAFSKTRETV